MFFKAVLATGLMTIIGGSAGFAQQLAPQTQQQPQAEITDQQLEHFVEVLSEVHEIQAGMQEEMISAVEEQGLDINTFNQIAQQQQNPEAATTPVSDEEKAAFGRAMQSVQTMQMEMQQQMQAKIEENNMNLDEFNTLMLAYQQNPEVQEKVNTMMEQK